jgi:hypothetical protein
MPSDPHPRMLQAQIDTLRENLRRGIEGGGGGDPRDPGIEARVAGLEASVDHIREDVRDIKAALAQLVPVVNRMDGFLQATLPTLATKADVEREAASLRLEIGREAASLRLEIERRPTWARIVAPLVVLAAIAAVPFWGEWVTAAKTAISHLSP